jgi:hypothetical protein
MSSFVVEVAMFLDRMRSVYSRRAMCRNVHTAATGVGPTAATMAAMLCQR